AFVLLDIIRKSKFQIPDEVLARIQQNQQHRYQHQQPGLTASARGGAAASPPPSSKKWSGWSSKSSGTTGKLKDLTIGLMLQPRRWSL
ncbi:hypothetical protein FRC17_000284, partial [Serendipita sp. 399]